MILAPLILALLQQPPAAQPVLPVRPRDPFVFRCVLDKRARMLVAALDEDMWVAWDTTDGALVKAWKGGVLFDGAVYTTVHGPQPTSRGTEYTSRVEGAPWTVSVDGKPVAASAQYTGYVLDAGRLTLEWKIKFGQNREITVLETSEFARPKQLYSAAQIADAGLGDGAQPALLRDFEAIGLNKGEAVHAIANLNGIAAQFGQRLERVPEMKDEHGVAPRTQTMTQAALTALAPRNAIVLVFAPVVLTQTEEAK